MVNHFEYTNITRWWRTPAHQEAYENIHSILIKADATNDEVAEYIQNMKKLDLERIKIYIELLRDELQRSKVLQDLIKEDHRVAVRTYNLTNPPRRFTEDSRIMSTTYYKLEGAIAEQYYQTVMLLRQVVDSATGIPDWSS
jgi:hypothetical protein